jgi:hypothetical protein
MIQQVVHSDGIGASCYTRATVSAHMRAQIDARARTHTRTHTRKWRREVVPRRKYSDPTSASRVARMRALVWVSAHAHGPDGSPNLLCSSCATNLVSLVLFFAAVLLLLLLLLHHPDFLPFSFFSASSGYLSRKDKVSTRRTEGERKMCQSNMTKTPKLFM